MRRWRCAIQRVGHGNQKLDHHIQDAIIGLSGRQMKLSQFAIIAEILSAIAVVVTPVVLIFELQDDTRALQASTMLSGLSDDDNLKSASVTYPPPKPARIALLPAVWV